MEQQTAIATMTADVLLIVAVPALAALVFVVVALAAEIYCDTLLHTLTLLLTSLIPASYLKKGD